MANDPALAFKQIRTGFRKWIARYLQECPGESKNDVHDDRLTKIAQNTEEAFEDLADTVIIDE